MGKSFAVTGEYFDPTMVNRQRLLWAIATRRQLERWEPLVAAAVRGQMGGSVTDDADIWLTETEHHFALVAARNLFRALDLPPPASISIDATLRAELIEGRDLLEHWRENQPVLNVSPRRAQPPYPSGKSFAARNPKRGPYSWLSWNLKSGALLLPNVPASALHRLLDQVQADVLEKDESFRAFVPPRAPSPWLEQDGEWWPRPEGG